MNRGKHSQIVVNKTRYCKSMDLDNIKHEKKKGVISNLLAQRKHISRSIQNHCHKLKVDPQIET